MTIEDIDHSIKTRGYCLVEFNTDLLHQNAVGYKYNIILLCDKGHFDAEVNSRSFSIQERSIHVMFKVMLTNLVSVTSDFHGWGLLVDSNFWLDVTMGIPTERLELLFIHPHRKIASDTEWEIFSNMFHSFRLYEQMTNVSHSIGFAGCAFRGMVVLLSEILFSELGKQSGTTFSMSDNYVRQFMHMLDAQVQKQHEVAYYASQLGITPKYLSELCSQKMGHKAKEIISQVLLSKLKAEILTSGRSMKEIGYAYGLADLSSLGKFFRKMTGMSPNTYRKRQTELMKDTPYINIVDGGHAGTGKA